MSVMMKVGEKVRDYWYCIYVHGFMDGLASQWAGVGKLTKRNFNLT
jgi:hypothetical protein